YTYQFAVSVDDLTQKITHVIRGDDLLSSTGRQIQLAQMLGRAAPAEYCHHPLLLDPIGRKLGKRQQSARAAIPGGSRQDAETLLAASLRDAGLPIEIERITTKDLPEIMGEWLNAKRG